MKNTKRLIDYDYLGECVRRYEALKDEFTLDLDEEKLFLDIIMDRRNQKYKDLKLKTQLGLIDTDLLGSLMKRSMKAVQKEEEEQ